MTDITNPTPTIEQLLAIEACREAARRYSYGVDRLDGDVVSAGFVGPRFALLLWWIFGDKVDAAFSTCSGVAKPMTRSTPARLYQERSNSTISPAVGRCCT